MQYYAELSERLRLHSWWLDSVCFLRCLQNLFDFEFSNDFIQNCIFRAPQLIHSMIYVFESLKLNQLLS